jgi:hypothetical protein
MDRRKQLPVKKRELLFCLQKYGNAVEFENIVSYNEERKYDIWTQIKSRKDVTE